MVDGRLQSFTRLQTGALGKVWRALEGEGEETRLVGGAVRDLALGREATDFDLATTATPDVVITRAERAGLKVALTGVSHGTVTVIAEGRPFETTTLRQDVDTDGRHAKVAFGRDFAADAMRRDFTINALSLGSDGRIFDVVGGLDDLKAGRVRFIGEARRRVREDYLRILRFFRFSAAYATGPLDAEGLAACIAERAGLSGLSRERVRAELLKLLTAARADEVAGEAAEVGLLFDALGGLAYAARLKKLVAVEAAHRAEPDALLRLAALAIRVREDAERLRGGLRLSNAETLRLLSLSDALAKMHDIEAPPSLGDLRTLLFTYGRRTARDAMMLAHVDSRASADAEAFLFAVRFLESTPEPKLPFGGTDLIRKGVPNGPGIGATLKDLQAAWIREGMPKEPEVLARLLEEALARAASGAG